MRKIIPLVLILTACGKSFTAGTSTTASASAGGAEAPAGGAAGMVNGGGGDAGEGAGGSGGGNGGLSGGDSGGSAGSVGSAGSGTGGAGAPTCPQLFSRAKAELDAASVCDDSAKAQQCTGTVTNTCGCKVPIEKNDSVEAQAYLSTLGQIKQTNCHENCPLIPCASITGSQCNVPSGVNNHVGICANGVP